MIPKVAGKGRSFKGAGLYYLHDKNALTRERVAFTHTENLPTLDPDKAIKCMAWTALRQQELKARSGGSAKGRKLTQPVYCYSLSWAPGEEPSQEEMIGAAKDTLAILGLQDHEALLVGHNDEPHPHIHVIVNRVHPETGIAAPLNMDHLKLSAWAEAFEKRQGQIRCEQRVENNERRRYGEFVKDRDSQHAAEFRRWQQERTARQVDNRLLETAVLDARHEKQRDDLHRERDRKIDAKRKQVREATRAEWRAIYQAQASKRRELESAQRSAWSRLRFFVRTHGGEYEKAAPGARIKMLKGAFSALIGSHRQFDRLEQKQLAERKAKGKKIKARTQELLKPITAEHERRLKSLREKQAQELHEQRMRHSRESQAHAKEIKEGRERQVFEAERDAKRKQELAEQKADVTTPPKQPPDNSLRARFRAARGAQQPSAKEQTTGKDAKDAGKASGGLAERFRRAKDGVEADKKQAFKDNARDTGLDKGRERSRAPKPPKPPKPEDT
jgi:MobA/VirD2-like, nuclease domain